MHAEYTFSVQSSKKGVIVRNVLAAWLYTRQSQYSLEPGSSRRAGPGVHKPGLLIGQFSIDVQYVDIYLWVILQLWPVLF